jgi:hypothetical protein
MPNKWICDMCLPNVKEIGEVIPALWLGFDKDSGKYVLVGGPDGGDILHSFKEKPTPDIYMRSENETEREWENRYNSLPKSEISKDLKWIRMARKEFEKTLDREVGLDQAVDWASRLREGGWKKKKGSAAIWLYDKCGKILKKWPKSITRIREE